MNFSYMGTKRAITPIVNSIAQTCKDGPFLDLFCGIGSVGKALADIRPLWCNDVQQFAVIMAKCNFTDPEGLLSTDFLEAFTENFMVNQKALLERWSGWVNCEREATDGVSVELLSDINKKIPNVFTSTELAESRAANCIRKTAPYDLFTSCYAGTYLGISQCIEIDSAIFAIDALKATGALSFFQQHWLLLAVCNSASKCSTTTGHFAQFLTANENNVKYFVNKRKKSIYKEIINCIPHCVPCGSNNWRQNNKVYNFDAISLLEHLKNENKTPGVIYADPPYTEEQYSRYYHLYETLILYDYPEVFAKARYRAMRYRSPFSVKTEVNMSMNHLIEKSSEIGSDFMLSYPAKGLLGNSIEAISGLLRKYYSKIEIINQFTHSHSSFGASNTRSRNEATELIFLATH